MEVVHSNLAHKLHRGDESMVVAEYQLGKTKIKINNAYVCKTQDERAQVDHEIAMVGWSIIDELIERGEEV
ncbi:hypothetical protein D3C72_1462770 [compost metagenome]